MILFETVKLQFTRLKFEIILIESLQLKILTHSPNIIYCFNFLHPKSATKTTHLLLVNPTQTIPRP